MTNISTMQRFLFCAVVALVLRGAPTAVYAQNNTIHACVHNTHGGVRIVAPASSCKNNESPLSWNVQGPIGLQGEQG